MNIPHLVKSSVFGLACLGFGSVSQAAVVGGASVDIANGVFLSTAVADGFEVSITGDFVAQSLIADFDAVTSYEASADVILNGASVLNGSAILPPTSINRILGVADDLGLAALFAPVLTQNPGAITLPPVSIGDILDVADGFGLRGLLESALPPGSGALTIFGFDADYSYDITGLTPNSVSGMFTIGLILPAAGGAILDLASPTDGATFSASLAIAPVPLPAALPLALGGFALLGLAGWRRRARV